MFYAINVVVVHILRDERDCSVHSALGARHGRLLSAAGHPIRTRLFEEKSIMPGQVN